MTCKVKVIGAGGIGSHLIEPMVRYLAWSQRGSEITVQDGDKFEERNKERQRCTAFENKADHVVSKLQDEFPASAVSLRSKPDYVTEQNILRCIRPGDIILLCVDNHNTRKLISDRCEEIDDIALISGGNDLTDGDVTYYCRKDGADVAPTKPLTKMFPSIAEPKDLNPGSVEVRAAGCDTTAPSQPQLLQMNFAIASAMLSVLRLHVEGKTPQFNIVYLDIDTLKMRPAVL